jgi:hypothetical protein
MNDTSPTNLNRRERRLVYARRMDGNELPEAALIAYAEWPDDQIVKALALIKKKGRKGLADAFFQFARQTLA